MTDRTRLDSSIRSRRPLSSSLISILVLFGAAMACSGNSELGGGNSDAKGGAGNGLGGASNGQAGTTTSKGGSTQGKGGVKSASGATSNGGSTEGLGGATSASGATSNGGSTEGLGGVLSVGGKTSNGKGGAPNERGGNAPVAGTPSASGALGKGGSSANGGAAPSGGAVSRGGAGSGGDCNQIQCFRAIECVASCGGPILQSGCCPCPTGTFDSIQCSGAGGASSTGGSSSKAGASSTGGAGTGGASSLVECKTAADCSIMGDCCGCHSLAPGQDSGCPMECLSSQTCDGFDPQPTPQCRGGRCVLSSSCDNSRVTCKIAVPQCAAGKLPTVTVDGTCYDGNCIDITECSAVSSCSVCSSTTSLVATQDLICVYDLGVKGVAHCVSVPACMLASRCACYGELCNGISPCGELSNGISCGGG